MKLKLLELFGGIGACSKALDNLGIDYEIADYVEIDKYAVASYNAIHNTNFVPQDICEWDKDIEIDLIMHGSPCQDFSLVGKQAGGDENSGTRSSLMYETLRIIEKLKPKYVIWENVKNLLSYKHRHNFIKYVNRMESLGYKNYYQVLNAVDYGIPQQRKRVFTISIRNDIKKDFSFPPKTELKLKLKDMLEKDVDEKYYLSDKMIRYILATGTKDYYYKPEIDLEIARHLSTDQNKRAGTTNYVSEDFIKNGVPKKVVIYDDYNNRIKSDQSAIGTLTTNIGSSALRNGTKLIQQSPTGLRIRKLTPKECWRLMGFSDEDFDKAAQVNSNAQLYKQAGNSIVVNVLMAILTNLLLVETKEDKQLTLF